MPYIKQADRLNIDSQVNRLSSACETVGDLNYAITTLLLRHAELQPKVGYPELNGYVGVLESAKLEFYRRRIAPYEDKKIAENGDVY
jgi:hypothetical protein